MAFAKVHVVCNGYVIAYADGTVQPSYTVCGCNVARRWGLALRARARTHRIRPRDRGALGIKAKRIRTRVEHLHNEHVGAELKESRACVDLAFELPVGGDLEVRQGLAVERGGLKDVVHREGQIEGGDLRRSHLEAAAQYA